MSAASKKAESDRDHDLQHRVEDHEARLVTVERASEDTKQQVHAMWEFISQLAAQREGDKFALEAAKAQLEKYRRLYPAPE